MPGLEHKLALVRSRKGGPLRALGAFGSVLVRDRSTLTETIWGCDSLVLLHS